MPPRPNCTPKKIGPPPDCGPIKQSVTDWPKSRFDLSNTGYNPYETILSPTTVGNLVPEWQHFGGSVISSPAVVSGVVYLGCGHSVCALNGSTGCRLWSYQTEATVDSSPAVANGVVYVGSDDGNLYALDVSTGALLWNYTTTGAVINSSPAVVNGVVYVGSADGYLYAL